MLNARYPGELINDNRLLIYPIIIFQFLVTHNSVKSSQEQKKYF